MGKTNLIFVVLLGVFLIAGCVLSGSSITFTVPAHLPNATVGVFYSYSFCQPDSSRSSESCGGPTTNPTGGNPAYSFLALSGAYSLPPGIALDQNGLLGGTPLAPGNWSFVICAKDSKGAQACHPTSLTVLPNSPGVPGNGNDVPGANGGLKLSVNRTGSGNGAVTGYDWSGNSVATIDCGVNCTAYFPANDVVALWATADLNSSFDGWGGACSGTNSYDACKLTMDSNKFVTASFTKTGLSIDSASCTYTQPYGSGAEYRTELKGTATGPVGAKMQFRSNLFAVFNDGKGILSCGGWSDCVRKEGEPETASWEWSFDFGASSNPFEYSGPTVELVDQYSNGLASEDKELTCQ